METAAHEEALKDDYDLSLWRQKGRKFRAGRGEVK